MRKLARNVLICGLIAALTWVGMLIGDRKTLDEELIRLHVVANSDSDADQSVKLQVRDAIVESLRQGMADVTDVEQAKKYLEAQLPKLEALANETLKALGQEEQATVSLTQECFDTREYDTFSLPAGVYESLRIVIGAGGGTQLVVRGVPGACLPATVAEFEDQAVECGLSDDLTATLTGEEGYEIRFFLLDWLGRVENFFHGSN